MTTTRTAIEAQDLRYHIPPVCQGQIVEISYALTEDGEYVIRRTRDRSDGTVVYQVAEMNDEPWEPWNDEPTIPSDAWQEVA